MPDGAITGSGQESSPAFTEIEHTADYALRIYGRDYGDLLRNAAMGLYSLIGAKEEKKTAGALTERRLTLDAEDAESLLVEWLSELAYWVESTRFIGTGICFTDVGATHLEAVVRGWEAGEVDKLIKAVTYHELSIEQTPSGLAATVVFDV